MRRIANFIDAAYLACISQHYGNVDIDFRRLAETMAGGCDILRTHFYDCLPCEGRHSTPRERERLQKKQRFVAALSHLPRFEVRLGQLEFRGRSEDGAPIFQQKRVDVRKGVDLAVAAAKQIITDAAILAGDSDFIPAVEAAKAEGVVVHLFHGPNTHRDLIEVCDERTYLSRDLLESLARRSSRDDSLSRQTPRGQQGALHADDPIEERPDDRVLSSVLASEEL